jgi:hypothetical protein
VLSLVGARTTLIVEFKELDAPLVAATHALLHAHRAARTVVWFGLQGAINPLLRCVDPAIPTINSLPEMLRCFAAWHLGVAPFLPLAWLNGNASVLGVPADRVDAARLRQNKTFGGWPDWAVRALAACVGGDPSAVLLCPALLRHLREARGVPAWFLGINAEPALRAVQRAGASAALTDRPRWLAAMLRADQQAGTGGGRAGAGAPRFADDDDAVAVARGGGAVAVAARHKDKKVS